jgi:hypothetical protein
LAFFLLAFAELPRTEALPLEEGIELLLIYPHSDAWSSGERDLPLAASYKRFRCISRYSPASETLSQRLSIGIFLTPLKAMIFI